MLDFNHWIEGAGVIGGLLIIGAIIFAESGLLIGFFLPGDTLLFSAGFFAAQDKLPLAGVLAVILACAIIGDNVGYTIGKKAGPRLFRKKDGIIFRQEYIQRAEAFYEKHGGKTIILARFIPIVRTFAPVVAGVGNMHHGRFALYNVIGASIWTFSIVMLGYWLGSLIEPEIMERWILIAVALAMTITFAPMLWHIFGDKQARARMRAGFSRFKARKDESVK